jgi:chromosomal replication initiator protein
MRAWSTQEVVTEDSIVAVRELLRRRMGPPRFDLWFAESTQLRWAGKNGLIVEANTALLRDWLVREFSDLVKSVAVEVCKRPMEVQFEAAPAIAENAPTAQPAKQLSLPLVDATAPDNEPSHGSSRAPERPTFLTDELNFMSFVEGTSNRAAMRATQSACGAHGSFAPLVFLWGPHGVGKTHLLRAARNEFRRLHRRGRVLYLTAEQFTTDFLAALNGRGLPVFRQKHRGVDLLLLDDVHFLARKPATLEEFQYTLDTLTAAGGRAILTSNREPAALFELGPEIASRLAAGIACEMQWPEYEVRLGILHNLCSRQQLTLSDDVMRTLAAGISLGPRELVGALNRMQVLHEVLQEPIERPLAERVVAEINHQCTRPVQLDDIQRAVCVEFGLEPKSLKSNNRAKAVSEPRMLAMWLARKYTRAAWSEIGVYFGRRSHSTVISAHRRVEQLLGRKTRVHTPSGECELEEAVRRVENALRTA